MWGWLFLLRKAAAGCQLRQAHHQLLPQGGMVSRWGNLSSDRARLTTSRTCPSILNISRTAHGKRSPAGYIYLPTRAGHLGRRVQFEVTISPDVTFATLFLNVFLHPRIPR